MRKLKYNPLIKDDFQYIDNSIPAWGIGKYLINDIVNYNGVLYVNITGTNTDINPASDTTNWARYTEIDDNQSTINTTYSSSKIDSLIANIPQGSGSSKILYLTSTEVFTGYDLLSETPETTGEVQESVTVNNSEGLIDSYATEALGITSIPNGNWSFNVWTNADNLGGVSNVIARVYKRTSVGTETLLLEETSQEITSITYQELSFEYIQASDITIATTDRLVVKFYGVTTRNSPTTISIFHGSPERYSHIHTTIQTIYNIGQPNGIASLDGGGKVPSSQLPSYVDDILEYANLASFPVTGETGKLYLALDTNKLYRWSGSVYVSVSEVAGLTNGQVTFGNSTGGLSQSSELFWNQNNNRLGIGTTAPTAPFHILKNQDASTIMRVENTNALGRCGYVATVDIGSLFYDAFGSTSTASLFPGYGRLSTSPGMNGLLLTTAGNKPLLLGTNDLERMRITGVGRVGIGTIAPTATLHIKAGTATANTSPIKLTAGTNLTNPEDGAFEFDGTNLYFTVGGLRKTVTLL